MEHLVGYAKRDLIVPQAPTVNDLTAANTAAAVWCVEMNTAVHSEICAVPADRLEHVGRGSSVPIAPNTSPEGRALNRRVEIVVGGEIIGQPIGPPTSSLSNPPAAPPAQ